MSSILGSERMEKGRPFQIEGPTTAKARFCLVEVRAKGTWRRPSSADRRERELRALSVGHRAQQDRSEQGPANNAIPMEPSYIEERRLWLLAGVALAIQSLADFSGFLYLLSWFFGCIRLFSTVNCYEMDNSSTFWRISSQFALFCRIVSTRMF